MGIDLNMKANRKFKEEEAVSAVIGVILMVAITVAIAATVYVYVSGMLKPTNTRKTLSATKVATDTTNECTQWKVTSTDAGIDWTKISLTWANGTAPANQNLTSLATGTLMTGNVAVGQYFWIQIDDSGTFVVDLIYNGNIIWTTPAFVI